LSRYNSISDEQKHLFISRFTRRNIITEKRYWKFFLNLNEGESPDNLENLEPDILKNDTDLKALNYGLGIRSISDSLLKERLRVIKLHAANKASGSGASAPFIKERREVIRRLRNSIKERALGKNIFIGT
jgi:hypothetical protein